MPTTTAGLYDPGLLRSWREQAGKSKERVAADLGMSSSWLAIIENGTPRRGPSLALMIKLADYYGHALDDLLVRSAA